MRRHAHRSLVLASLLSVGALACNDTGEPVIPESIAIAAGNGQTGAVGAALGTALAVTVAGSDGDPMEGATVTWAVTAGGGTIAPTTSTTDALGRASATWTLGGSTGQQAATATVQGLAAAAFTATATVGAPATVTLTPASPTIDALQGTVQLAAQAKDAFGNDVAGSTFVWTSLDPSTVTVNAQTGLATGVKVGTAQVTAVTGGKTGTVSVQVRQVPTSIVIGPANPRVSAGGTIQLTATARDANGNAIPGQTFTWSSATAGVATVNGSGLVTGVAGGTSNVTATSGSLNATIAVNVVNNLAPTSNTTVSGTMNIGRLTIPAGVTVTATSDVVINAFDAIQINGTLVGNCVDITINGTAAATYAGIIRNTCTAAGTGGTADMLLANDGPLTVSNATFEYDGNFELKNDPAITPATTGAPLPASPLALSVSQTGACTVTGTTFRPSTAAARAGANGTSSGGNGASAGAVRLLCDGDLNIGGGAAVEARDGGAGGDGLHPAPTTDNATGRGGDGGNGGDLNIRANGNITFTGTTLRLASGGDGGDQTVLGRDPGGSATATAGNGGNGGNTRVVASGSINIATGGLTIIVGRGGHGGEAIANAGNGLNAGASAATAGGNATATGGNGGNSVDGRLTAGGAVTGLANIAISGGDGGRGGAATAVAGKGGDGNLEFL